MSWTGVAYEECFRSPWWATSSLSGFLTTPSLSSIQCSGSQWATEESSPWETPVSKKTGATGCQNGSNLYRVQMRHLCSNLPFKNRTTQSSTYSCINWTISSTHLTRHRGIAYYFTTTRWIEALQGKSTLRKDDNSMALSKAPSSSLYQQTYHWPLGFLPFAFCQSTYFISVTFSVYQILSPSPCSSDNWTRPDRGCLQF